MDLKERHGSGPRHPWESSRFDFFSRALATARPSGSIRSILDVGSGDAWFARRLAEKLGNPVRITCWDSGYEEAVVRDVARDLDPRIQLVGEQPNETFDAVLMLDVLEHVPDDAAFLRSIVDQNMAPGSVLIFSVPAWQMLWSSHDRELHHMRRYAPEGAARVLRDAGLAVRASGGLFHSLILPRAVQVAAERVLPARARRAGLDTTWRGGELVTAVIRGALGVDNYVSRLASSADLQLPGLSWWASCERT